MPTATIVESGQPRPYADRRTVVRLEFEEPVTEEQAREFAASQPCGYHPVQKQDKEGWWASHEAYFRKIEENGRLWEFKVVHPFTD